MELKEAYNKHEAVNMQNQWKKTHLFMICSMKSGEGITSSNIHEGDKYPCYGGNGLRGYTNSYTHKGSFTLIGRQGALCGNVLFVEGEFFASEHAVVVTPSKQTDIRWLSYALDRMNLNQYSESSAQPGLSVKKLLSLEVYSPPTKIEQSSIAKTLNDADAWIHSLTQLITKKRQIKQGAMQTLLNPYENGKLKKGWVKTKLAVMAEIVTGNTPATSDKSNYGDKYLFVSPGDLGKDKWIKDTEKKLSRKGFNLCRKFPASSILFTCIGSTIGKAGMAIEELTSNQQINAILPNENYSSEFLYYFLVLAAPKIRVSASEQAVPIINKSQFGDVTIFIPSEINEQASISNVLSDMDKEIIELEAKLSKAKQIKQGMMQNLLTGRIRLI
ncbi:TPA: hypothetical protein F8S49_11350 [Legionella pneumophila]|nr:hypothetical protein [Legionella pneumophila]HAU1496584.1 hypothetical protein [Legionella pneumophila]